MSHPSAQNKPFRLTWLALLATLVAVVVVSLPALSGPFLFDDLYLPFLVPQFRSQPLSVWLVNAHTRFVLVFTYWLNYQVSGASSTFGYHLVNVLLHYLNGILVYLVVSGVVRRQPAAESQGRLLPAFAALLFLLHPLQTESVSYVAGRSETLSATFCLAALAIFLSQKTTVISTRAAIAVLALVGLACLTKEHSLAILPLLLLTDYYWNPGFSMRGIRGNRKLYLPVAIAGLLAGAFIARTLHLSKSAGFGMPELKWYEYFFTQCRVIWIYIRLFVFPFGQNLDHDVPLSRSLLSDSAALAGFLALAALVLLAWYQRRRYPLVSYGVLTLLILLAPTSSFIPLRDPLAEHRLYLPFLGFLFVTVGLLQHAQSHRAAMAAALVLLLAVAAGLSFARNRLWGDAVAMWQDSISKSPRKVRPRFGLAYALYESGRCSEAVAEYAAAARLETPQYELLVDWGLALDCADRRQEAAAVFERAAALQETAHVDALIAMEHAKDGHLPQALALLDRAAAIDPSFEITFLYRGNVYALMGERQKAAADFRRVLALNAGNAAAREALEQLNR